MPIVGVVIVAVVVCLACVGVGVIYRMVRDREADPRPVANVPPPADPRTLRGGDGKGADPGKDVNLLVNGSFEDGPDPGGSGFLNLPTGSTAVKGWVVSQGDIDYVGSYYQAADGRRSLDLDGSNRGGVAQTFQTRKGQKYRVTFRMAGNPNPADGGVKTLEVRAAGASAQFSFDVAGRSNKDMGWVEKCWEFVAAADRTTLEFISLSGRNCGPALDDVAVVALGE
jgi:choice-of-anchor C domain-containing protein